MNVHNKDQQLTNEAVDKLNSLVDEAWREFRAGKLSADSKSRESATSKVLHLFSTADTDERVRIASRLSPQAKDDLVGYALKMATLSVRHGRVDLVREGLVALALEAGTGSDQRDSMVSLALLYHSAVKLGMNVQAAFSQAALLAPASFEGAIRLFPNRPPRQLDLEAWGFKEATTKDGFGYQLR